MLAIDRYSLEYAMPSAINKPLYRRTLSNLFDARVKAVFRHLIVARDLMTQPSRSGLAVGGRAGSVSY